MEIHSANAMLGGLSPVTFMRRHWQKLPLVVRQAWPRVRPPVSRAELFALAGRGDVESRLVRFEGAAWSVRAGPLLRRALPPISQRQWTLLVQGLDLHVAAARAMLDRFVFIPHARVDDLMLSWASDGGGVGPHLDSYDVFLLQVQGTRRWRIGRCRDPRLLDDAPLKILRHFEPEQEFELEPGDLLYLPPRWAHDGVAIGECMTCSIGLRAPSRRELARDIFARLSDDLSDDETCADDTRYADRAQTATRHPGRIPPALADFAAQAVRRALQRRGSIARALGEALTEPKPHLWFEPGAHAPTDAGVRLDPRTRMLYDQHGLYVNGESWTMSGSDARVMRALADQRHIDARAVARLGSEARAVLAEWVAAGWMHGGCNDDDA